jgi:hypothetical protein
MSHPTSIDVDGSSDTSPGGTETTKPTHAHSTSFATTSWIPTSISLRKETREKLRRYGKKGETWDHLINRILDEVLPRQPAGLQEIERRRRDDQYIPLDEALKELDKL